MGEIKNSLDKIASNTKDVSMIISEQTKLIDGHFSRLSSEIGSAAADSRMAEYRQQQHREWQRFVEFEKSL